MRLLNAQTYILETFNSSPPPYLILSHRWRDGEILFEDIEGLEKQTLESRVAVLEAQLAALLDKDGRKSRLSQFLLPASSDKTQSGDWAATPREENLRQLKATKAAGWAKIEAFCAIAARFGVDFVWVDTCCINKNSSTELAEAINSMFAWYQNAVFCVAYLDDVVFERSQSHMSDRAVTRADVKKALQRTVWLTRCWTLQELIAPTEVWFFGGDWNFLDVRSDLSDVLESITGIDSAVLRWTGQHKLHDYSAATKLSWAAFRDATREEDKAYSLMGLFGVNMPILYGEGMDSAFYRLQLEIFHVSSDQSLFAWDRPWDVKIDFSDHQELLSLWAPSPYEFWNNKKKISRARFENSEPLNEDMFLRLPVYRDTHVTNVQLLMAPTPDGAPNAYTAILECYYSDNSLDWFQGMLIDLKLVDGRFMRVQSYLRDAREIDITAFKFQDIYLYGPDRTLLLEKQIWGHVENSNCYIGDAIILNDEELRDAGYERLEPFNMVLDSSKLYPHSMEIRPLILDSTGFAGCLTYINSDQKPICIAFGGQRGKENQNFLYWTGHIFEPDMESSIYQQIVKKRVERTRSWVNLCTSVALMALADGTTIFVWLRKKDASTQRPCHQLRLGVLTP